MVRRSGTWQRLMAFSGVLALVVGEPACSPRPLAAKPPLGSPPSSSAKPVPTPAPVVTQMVQAAPPPELGLVATFAAPETDLRRLAALADPLVGQDIERAPNLFRDALGSGLGSELELTHPAFLVAGTDPDQLVAFSVALKNGLSNLPPELELVKKGGEDRARLQVKDGSQHPWLDDNACDAYVDPKPNGQLVCAPHVEALDALSDYAAKLGQHAPSAPPPIQIDVFPKFFGKLFADDKDFRALGVELAKDLESGTLVARFAANAIELQVDARLSSVTTPLGMALAGPATPAGPPSDFPEAPPSALFAASFGKVDVHAAAAFTNAFGQDADDDKEPSLEELKTTLSALVGQGPVAFAYGLDLTAVQKNLAAWVAADVKEKGAAAPRPGRFQAVASWRLLRIEGPQYLSALKSLAKVKSTSAVKGLAIRALDKLPNGTLHLVYGSGSPADLDPEVGPLHLYFVPQAKSLLVVMSHRENVALEALRGALKVDPKRTDVLRANKGSRAIGMASIRAELALAADLSWISSYSRERSLERLKDFVAASGAKPGAGTAPLSLSQPARIEYFAQRAPTARATLLCSLPNPSLTVWLRALEML